MTNEEAESALKALSDHFKQPVMPIGRYCEIIDEWFQLQEARLREIDKDTARPYARASEHRVVNINIHKSNFLARRLYGGEKLRIRKCPAHSGQWSGIEFPGNECPYGCGFTGWLPEL